MKRINPSYLYIFILAAISQPILAHAQASTATTAPVITKTVAAPASTATAPDAQVETLNPPKHISQKPDDSPPPALNTVSMTSGSSPLAGFQPTMPAKPNVVAADPSAPDFKIVHMTGNDPLAGFQPIYPPKPNVVAAPVAQPPADYYLPSSAPAGAQLVSSTLSEADLSKAGLSLSFNGMSAQLNGNIPSACANNLVMDVVPNRPGDDDSSDDKTSDLQNQSDLDQISTKVGVRVVFRGNDKQKTLADCMSTESSDKVTDVSSLSRLNKPALLKENELARMGLMGDDMKPALGKKAIQSPSYAKILKVLKYKDCPSCAVDPTHISAALDELNGQPVATDSLRGALLDKALADVNEKIEKAKSVSDIKKLRDELVSYAKLLNNDLKNDSDDRDSRLSQIQDAFTALQAKTGNVAYSDSKHADKYADLISETGKVISGSCTEDPKSKSNPLKLDQDFADQQSEVCASYKKGGSERLDFISSIDPDHSEIRTYLNGAALQLHNAQQAVNSNCKSTFLGQSRLNTTACQQSIAKMQTIQTQAEGLATKFIAAQELPSKLAPTQADSFAFTGQQQKGYFPYGNGTSMPTMSNTLMAQNSTFGLPSLFPTSNMYQPVMGSQYQVNAPNYSVGAQSQYQMPNQAVGVPLNPALIPNTMSNGGAFGPQYQYVMNGVNG